MFTQRAAQGHRNIQRKKKRKNNNNTLRDNNHRRIKYWHTVSHWNTVALLPFQKRHPIDKMNYEYNKTKREREKKIKNKRKIVFASLLWLFVRRDYDCEIKQVYGIKRFLFTLVLCHEGTRPL